jgi:hypothetical protein
MKQGRFWTEKEYPYPDNDSAGNLILYVDEDVDEDVDEECVVVVPEGNGWREVLGKEPDFDAYRGE